MSITRITLGLSLAVSMFLACAGGGEKGNGGSSGSGSNGSGGASGSGGGACGDSVVCSPSLSYKKCPTASGGCYIELSNMQQVSCPSSCASCPNGCTAGGTGGTAGTGAMGSGGAAGTGGTGGTAGTGVGDGGGGPPDGSAACTSMADAGGCVNCCATAFSEGSMTFYNAWGDCLCKAPGVCATQCGSSLCAGKNPTSACDSCYMDTLGGTDAMPGACNSAVNTACSADPSCISFVECANGCP